MELTKLGEAMMVVREELNTLRVSSSLAYDQLVDSDLPVELFKKDAEFCKDIIDSIDKFIIASNEMDVSWLMALEKRFEG